MILHAPPHPARDPRPPRSCRLGPVSLAALLAMAVLCTAPASPARAETQSVGTVLWDLVVERPVGLVETTVGVAVAGVAYPLALGSGRAGEVTQRCIRDPARYTFTRALGDFSEQPGHHCGPMGLAWGGIGAAMALVDRPLGFFFGRSPLSETPPRRDELEVEGGPPRGPEQVEL